MRILKQIVAVAALAAFFVALPRGYTEPRDGWNLESRVPASTLAFASIEDVGGMQARFDRTAIAGLFREPEMKAFAAPIQKALDSMLEPDKGGAAGGAQRGLAGPFGEAGPMIVKVLKQLQGLKGQVAVALLDVDLDQKMPKLVASLDFGQHVGDFVTFLQGLRKQIDPEGKAVKEMQKDGRTWWQLQDGPPLSATTVDTTFVLATSPDLLQQVVSGPSADPLATSANFQAVRAKAGGDDLGVFAFANVPSIVKLLGPKMGEENLAVANKLGLDTVQGAAYGMSFAGDGFMDSFVLHAPGADHGIVPLMHMGPFEARALPFAPANTFLFDEGNANLDQILPNVRALVKDVDPDAAAQMDKALQKANASLGVDVEKDLLAGLEGHTGFYVSMPDTGGLYPEVAVLLQVKDPTGCEATMERACQGLAGTLTEGGRIVASTRTLEYHGRNLHLFEMQKAHGRGIVPFTPTWALIDDWFVATLVPHAMKEIVLRHDDTSGAGLAAQEDYQSLRRVMPAGTGMMRYVDLQAILGLLYDTAVPLLQTVAKPNVLGHDVPFPLDWAQLPAARTVRPYLRSLAVFASWNKDGISVRMHGPLPMLGVAMAAGAAAIPALTLARSRAMSHSRAMRGMPIRPPMPMPYGAGGPADAKARLARSQAEQIASYVRVFVLTQRRLPNDLSELVAKDIMPKLPKDPWGTDYMFVVRNAKERRFQVISAGPDGDFGTADDIRTGQPTNRHGK
jgi:hypothetical protein